MINRWYSKQDFKHFKTVIISSYKTLPKCPKCPRDNLKKMSYIMTLSQKVEGGQDEIILLEATKIGLFVTNSKAILSSILMAKMALKVDD